MEGITLKGKSKPAQLDICRVAAYLNHFLHLTGVTLRFTPSGEKYVRQHD
jgi:hypothetical protein